jgi:hypothetical protein
MIKNHPKEFMPQEDKLWGIYRGVIEDNKDPEKMGRCKVRVFGVHTEKKQKDEFDGIPTDELPWAEPALGLFEGSVSGFGQWTIPLQGSHVFLFFENGHILNPRFFASVPGKPTDVNHGFEDIEGFSDPDKKYPAEHRLNEPDFHRLSRDVSNGTIVDYKNDNKVQDIQLALGQGDWEEPEPFYLKSDEKYPNNIVLATHRGLIIELDNSDKPRLHIYHPSNSFIEIDNEGNKIIKNTGTRYSIVLKDLNEYTEENHNTTVKGNKTQLVENDKYTEVAGDENAEIGGDVIIEIGGDKTVDIGGAKTVSVGGDVTIEAGGNCNITAGGNVVVSGSMVLIN